MNAKQSYYVVGDFVYDEVLGVLSLFANEALRKQGHFRVGVSGGLMAAILAEGLYALRTDFNKWQIFFCDERFVPKDSADSIFGCYERNLLDFRSEVPKTSFYPVNTSLSPTEAAVDYEKTIRKAFNLENSEEIPSFDMLLLDIGTDGHTASLFPAHPLLEEDTMLIAPIENSPEPPANRVTMTYTLINNAKVCMFAAVGKSRAEILKRMFVDKDQSLPVTRVNPINGEVIFVVCNEAHSLIELSQEMEDITDDFNEIL
ncbi:6-phosphogluconolactonase-like [Sabethes cyaneus]|uniref:6-phosphogluconolactonase-like n=1 Tax=Sabethes cyaneus TaxID=53552 RepID=UPI00237DE78C|nr:6-phosphogluconolactonase-like [Sabethes cyaneus]